MLEIYGMDWCGTCVTTQKHLTALDIPYTYHRLPPGEAGWALAQKLSGRRATPVIMRDGRNMAFNEFKQWIDSLGRKPRQLTQDELDAIE